MAGISYEDSILSDLENEIFMDEEAVVLKGVRCAAHSLQLGIEDAISSAENAFVAEILERVRALVKYLRTTNIMFLLNAQKLKKPILDYDTRWHSKCDMLERILELKEFCSSMEKSDPKL